VDERRRNLVGFVHGSMITGKLIDTVVAASTTVQGLDLFLFDPDGQPNALPLYIHASRLRAPPPEPRPQVAANISEVDRGAAETKSASAQVRLKCCPRRSRWRAKVPGLRPR
jgi:hypothetical protein